jgi:EAL domain-containing protein (putative c-di-GMP-specific phosphodiesterase class I)
MAGRGWAFEGGLWMAMGCEGGQGWFFGRPVPAGKLPWSTEGPIP